MAIKIDIIFVCAFYLEPTPERWTTFTRKDREPRATCIAAINVYHREHLHPLVVCSRKAEYEAASASRERLALHSAVVIQPLTTEQVDTYLEQCGKLVAALRRGPR